MGSSECLTVFAGINGAGKSTLFGTLSHLDFGVRLNSDEIVKELGLDWRDPKAQVQAGRLLLERQEECFKKRLSFNRESTLAGMSAMPDRNNTNRSQSNSFRRFCTAETWQGSRRR